MSRRPPALPVPFPPVLTAQTALGMSPFQSPGPYTVAGLRMTRGSPATALLEFSAFSMYSACRVQGEILLSSLLGLVPAAYTCAVEMKTNFFRDSPKAFRLPAASLAAPSTVFW